MSIADLIRTFAAWQQYRAAVRALSALDEKILSDIGLDRSMVHQAARDGRGTDSPSYAVSA